MLGVGCSSSAWGRTFADSLSTKFERPLGNALASSIAQSFPIPAASAGLTFEYDAETGAFIRKASMLGQVYLERPETIGRRRVNLSVSYQHVRIDTIDGEDLRNLSDHVPIRDPNYPPGFVIPRFGINLDTDQVVTNLTYGVTDDLELNVAVPVIYSEFGLDADFQPVGGGLPTTDHVRSSKVGVGDLLVRGKYQVLSGDSLEAALGLVVRIPTGNEGNFQGTGAVEVAPLVYLSHAPVPLGWSLELRPYVQGGLTLVVNDLSQNEPRWGVGTDLAYADRATLAVAVLGRHALAPIGPPGFTDAPRVGGGSLPLFGLTPGRPDFYELSVGGRINLWRDTVMAFGNVLLPLNNDGFRSDVIPLVGIEAAF
jgi:hypothetical protein